MSQKEGQKKKSLAPNRSTELYTDLLTSEKTLLLSELTCLHSDPGGSDGIESACNAEGPGSVPGSGT